MSSTSPRGWSCTRAPATRETLQNALLGLDPKLALVPRAGLIHRLDKDTSGLMVVARTVESHRRWSRRWRRGRSQREYVAICIGVLTGGGTVDEPIGRHRSPRTKMAVRADGRAAVTHFRIIERFRAHTQVRVSSRPGGPIRSACIWRMSAIPVVGDPVYGGRRR